MEVFAWPFVALAAALAAMLIFRRPLEQFIGRTQKLRLPGGIHVEGLEPAQQQALQPTPVDGALPSEQLGSPPLDPLCGSIESTAKTRIMSNVPDPKFHLDWALRLYAVAAIGQQNEFLYRIIFGSQLRAIKLAIQSNGRLKKDRLREIYASASFNFPEAYAEFDFTMWSTFFHRNSLAEFDQDGTMNLTARAYAFQTFVATSGVSDEKPL